MNTQTQEALKMAIESLEKIASFTQSTNLLWWQIEARKPINACKEALEQPAQEPVLPFQRWSKEGEIINKEGFNKLNNTHPHQWQGLTDDEIEYWECLKAPPVHPDFLEDDSWREFARCIEKALKEKNT